MKKLRILAVIFGLAVLALSQPELRSQLGRAFGGSERDQAARCLVVSKYMDLEIGDRLNAAASKRLLELLGNDLPECIETHTVGERATPGVINACLNYVHRFEEAANLEAFPDGDSSNFSTVRKWAKSDYCRELLTAAPPPAPAPVSEPVPAATTQPPASPDADLGGATPPSAWQLVQQHITADPEDYVRTCVDRFVESAQQLGGMSQQEALEQKPELDDSCRQIMGDLQACMKLGSVEGERCFEERVQDLE